MMRLRALSLLFVFLVLLFCLPATVEAQSLSKPLPNPLQLLWLDNDNHPNFLASREAIAEVLDKALRICIQKNGGVMVFSHRYMDQNGRWGAAQRGLDTVPQLPER